MFITETPYRAGWYVMKNTPAECDILSDALPLYVYINEGDMSSDALQAGEMERAQNLADLFSYKFGISVFSPNDIMNIYNALYLFLDACDDFPEVCAAPDADARALCSSMIDGIKDIALSAVD